MPEFHYKEAMKLAQKEYRACISKGLSPCLPVMDDFVPPEKALTGVNLGLVQIPVWFIVGTKSRGRVNAFASNFMPILDETSEFAGKWEALCKSHLSEGINEPIKVYEYMNRYYVEEGNKRVSVLKYFGGYSIPAYVTRVLPDKTDDDDVQLYYEFLEFNKYSHINFVEFSKKGRFKELLKAMGKPLDEEWSEEEQSRFSSSYYYFEQAYRQSTGDKLRSTVGDAMLSYIKIYGYNQLCNADADSIKKDLKKMREELKLNEEPEAIELMSDPAAEKKTGVLSKVIPLSKPEVIHVAFIYDGVPEKSGWVNDHEQGRLHVETVFDGQIVTKAYSYAMESDPLTVIEQAIADGNTILFTTSPRMLQSSLRAAVEHQDVVIMNCSLNISHRYVRTYYPRMYEVKFILGALAASLSKSGRIGYVCDYPIFGQIAGINAFALGAQMANPDSKVFLEWSAVKGAKEAALALSEQSVHIISSQDTTRFLEDDRHSFGLSYVGPEKTALLAVPVWKWGVYYEEILRRVLDNTIKTEYVNSSRSLNYYWGMSAGVVDIEYSIDLPTASRRFADFFRDSFIHGSATPFLTPFYTQNGDIIGAEQKFLSLEQIINMDYLVDNVIGSIPTYDELTPMGRATVDAVGIERAKSTEKSGEDE